MMNPFCLQEIDPLHYRRQTRKSSWVIIAVFAALGMLLSQLLVILLGSEGGNNFRWNLLGVILAVGCTYLLVRYYLSQQPLMKEAVYGWHLKRNLMRITNVMHRLKPLAEAGDAEALKLLRFYHLAVEQMHRLDGDESNSLEIKAEKKHFEERMQELGLDSEQTCLDPAWLAAVKDKKVDE
ncbi:DUF3087 family protein [Marinospirillum perlucidum]|uniref:DUF3087 family protein n=1 Tax=Marinospirillum perlucidum TaxID=1982602 RepID=UPI001C49A88D|nr:DUF3087 family protein [Marinospirillum perlucidum]